MTTGKDDKQHAGKGVLSDKKEFGGEGAKELGKMGEKPQTGTQHSPGTGKSQPEHAGTKR